MRQRTISNLFRLDSDDDVKLKALKNLAGIDSIADLEFEIEDAKDFGDVFVLQNIWDQINLDKAFGDRSQSEDDALTKVISLIRLMVFQRPASRSEAVRILNFLKRIEVSVKGEKISTLTKIKEEQLELFDLLEVDRPGKF